MKSPLKWHGGKYYLAPKIVSLMPPHLHYVEPYAGGLSVLLAKDPEGVSEVANDVYGHLMRFWYVMSAPQEFESFRRCVEATPFSEAWFDECLLDLDRITHPFGNEGFSSYQLAARFFVVCRQSLAGRMKSFAPLSKARTRGGMNEQVSAWLSAVDGLSDVHRRVRRVAMLNRDALEVILDQDGPHTLFYLDPPYLDETRASPRVYCHEMTRAQHIDLLSVVNGLEGKVMLSGYRSGLYDMNLCDWNRHDFELPNNAASGSSKRRMVESLWCNF